LEWEAFEPAEGETETVVRDRDELKAFLKTKGYSNWGGAVKRLANAFLAVEPSTCAPDQLKARLLQFVSLDKKFNADLSLQDVVGKLAARQLGKTPAFFGAHFSKMTFDEVARVREEDFKAVKGGCFQSSVLTSSIMDLAGSAAITNREMAKSRLKKRIPTSRTSWLVVLNLKPVKIWVVPMSTTYVFLVRPSALEEIVVPWILRVRIALGFQSARFPQNYQQSQIRTNLTRSQCSRIAARRRPPGAGNTLVTGSMPNMRNRRSALQSRAQNVWS